MAEKTETLAALMQRCMGKKPSRPRANYAEARAQSNKEQQNATQQKR